MPRRIPAYTQYGCPQCGTAVKLEDSSLLNYRTWWEEHARPLATREFEQAIIPYLTREALWACTYCLKAGRAILPNYVEQNFGMGGPIPIYADQSRKCRDCHQTFVFEAKEQLFWYEVLGFHYDSKAIRCAPCRKKLRTKKAAAQRLGTLLATEPVTVAVLEEIAAEYDAINNPTKATLYRARARNLANRLDGRGE